MTDGLAVERHALLRDAARKAGDLGLLPHLERLVLRYRAERAAAKRVPQQRELRQRMLDEARALEVARRALKPDPFVACRTAAVTAYIHPDLDAADFALAEQARRRRVAAAAISRDDRQPADRAPGGPLWRFIWALAELWAGRDLHVSKGLRGRFGSFANDVFLAADEHLTDRLVTAVASRWQANYLAADPRKAPLPATAA